jgi:hypothetical protein
MLGPDGLVTPEAVSACADMVDVKVLNKPPRPIRDDHDRQSMAGTYELTAELWDELVIVLVPHAVTGQLVEKEHSSGTARAIWRSWRTPPRAGCCWARRCGVRASSRPRGLRISSGRPLRSGPSWTGSGRRRLSRVTAQRMADIEEQWRTRAASAQ